MDAWDAVKKNEFFSPEAFIFAFSQMFQLSKPPNRFTPEFQIYKKFKGWEIRRQVAFCACCLSGCLSAMKGTCYDGICTEVC